MSACKSILWPSLWGPLCPVPTNVETVDMVCSLDYVTYSQCPTDGLKAEFPCQKHDAEADFEGESEQATRCQPRWRP